jgi:hypothetical protein
VRSSASHPKSLKASIWPTSPKLWPALALALALGGPQTSTRASNAPASNTIPWVWATHDRIPDAATDAAVLIESFHLIGTAVHWRPRGLIVPLPAADPPRITPVVHVEVSRVAPPPSLLVAKEQIAAAVLRAARGSTSGWVQLDLEAPLRLKADYLELVQFTRASLPPGMRLSVTALAWWCTGGQWLDTLAADEVVPMFFRMGKDSAALRQTVSQSPERLHPKCRSGAIGTAVQEPLDTQATERYAKHYVFDYRMRPKP